SARAHYDLGRAYAFAQPDSAAEHFARASNIFRELGARLDLARAEEAAATLDRTTHAQSRHSETVAQLLTLRLAEAVASRELLLHELAAVIRQETRCKSLAILDEQRVIVSHGLNDAESVKLAGAIRGAQ